MGSKKPAANNAQEAAEATANPGMNEPDRSRRAPTKMGDTNMANPENVKRDPQTTATLSGVIPGISIGSVSSLGTYSHDPMPKMTTAG